MAKQELYMMLLGCKPKGRHTEQHDIFFSVGSDLKEQIPLIKEFWPGSGSIHIDAWRTVTECDGFKISMVAKSKFDTAQKLKLFFLNLGGYKPGEFEEFHYKLLVVAPNKSEAIKKAKSSAFYLHTGFKGAASHIDDKYGVDVDDFYEIEDILPERLKSKFAIQITDNKEINKDDWHLGYTNLARIK